MLADELTQPIIWNHSWLLALVVASTVMSQRMSEMYVKCVPLQKTTSLHLLFPSDFKCFVLRNVFSSWVGLCEKSQRSKVKLKVEFCALPGVSVSSASSSCAGRLTSVEVIDKTRSWSSTSCLKVGLCDGTACQHSLMIMYLKQRHQGLLTLHLSHWSILLQTSSDPRCFQWFEWIYLICSRMWCFIIINRFCNETRW